MDQSDRYANLNLTEQQLIAGGRHVLCAYVMKPKEGFGDYLQTAAHFAAESSTGTNVEVSTTDDFTRGVDALVYEIDEAKQIMKIAYPVELVRPQCHRRTGDDRLLPDPDHRQQPRHGRRRIWQDARFLRAAGLSETVRRTGDHHQGSLARARPSGGERRLHRRHHHQAEAWPAPKTLRRRLL